MVGICWRFSHLPLLLGVQLERTFPFLAHTHVLQRPLPLHRQHCGMMGREMTCVSQLILLYSLENLIQRKLMYACFSVNTQVVLLNYAYINAWQLETGVNK